MPSPDRILLDRHALLCWQAGSDRLSRTAQRAIHEAMIVGVSPISICASALVSGRPSVTKDAPIRRYAERAGDVTVVW